MKKIYLLRLTEDNPGYDENIAHIVVAGGPREARMLAAEVHMDDKPQWWTRSDCSNCVRIGLVPDNLNQQSRIVLTKNTGS